MLECAQCATGEEWRNSSRWNEEAEPKWKHLLVVDASGDESKIWCCKEQCCIGTWNVRSMNQGKLAVVKQEMASVNINILGICELKWMGMENLIQMTIKQQESHRRNGVALIINRRVWNTVLECNLKNDRMICLFPRQAIQHHSNPNLVPKHWCWRS